jgi:hypothetical protein
VLLGAVFRRLLEAAGRQRINASSRQNKGEMMTSNVKTWGEACDADEIEEEDVIRFDHGGRTLADCRLEGDAYHATDGLPTHERVQVRPGAEGEPHLMMSMDAGVRASIDTLKQAIG